MPSTATDLLRVTMQTPDRRVDLAVPEHVPVAALLPVLLRAGGDELADRGTLHGGWVLRDISGGAFDTGIGLAEQGVCDGDVLCLALADEAWPELDYDDAVEAVAIGAARHGRRWDGRATRIASMAAAIALFAAVLVALIQAGPPWRPPAAVALALAAVLMVSAVVAARVRHDGGVGGLLAAVAQPFAGFGGLLTGGVMSGDGEHSIGTLVGGPAAVALGSLAVVTVAVLGGPSVGRARAVFVAGAVAGVAGLVDAVLMLGTTAPRAAAITLGLLVLFGGLAPSVAARGGGLPRPPVTAPLATVTSGRAATASSGRATVAAPVEADALFRAVSRTDDVLAGLLTGVAVAIAGTSVVLAVSGGWAGRLLVITAACASALRARSYASVRHRAVVLIGAALTAAPLFAVTMADGSVGLVVAAGLAGVGLVTIFVGTGDRGSPYLGRLADVVEVVSLAAIVPLVCVALGLYMRLRQLHL